MATKTTPKKRKARAPKATPEPQPKARKVLAKETVVPNYKTLQTFLHGVLTGLVVQGLTLEQAQERVEATPMPGNSGRYHVKVYSMSTAPDTDLFVLARATGLIGPNR